MAYLDNTVITVDAVLTKLGRERLSQGGTEFQITKWALSDDEVDYSLYNAAHPLGSDYYSNIIESMPVLEAIPDETQAMRYKLYTSKDALVNQGQIIIPQLNIQGVQAGAGSGNIDTGFTLNKGNELKFTVGTGGIQTVTKTGVTGTSTTNIPDFTEDYVITLFNERAFTASGGIGIDSVSSTVNGQRPESSRNASNTLVRTISVNNPLTLTAAGLTSQITTKIRVFGAMSGATKTFTVTVNSQ